MITKISHYLFLASVVAVTLNYLLILLFAIAGWDYQALVELELYFFYAALATAAVILVLSFKG